MSECKEAKGEREEKGEKIVGWKKKKQSRGGEEVNWNRKNRNQKEFVEKRSENESESEAEIESESEIWERKRNVQK